MKLQLNSVRGGSAISLIATLAIALPACVADEQDDDPIAEGEYESAVIVRAGVDYSWARPSPTGLHAAGYMFASRYLSHDTGKNLTASEAHALRAAGVDIVANWEDSASGALGGFSRGASDAHTAASQAAAAGMPAGRPIYFSVDFDASASQQAAINAYFDGVASVLGRNRTGAYGGYYVIKRLFDAGKIAYGWQTYAWSGGNWDARAQLRQVQNGVSVAGSSNCCDIDHAVADDYGQWGYTGGTNTTSGGHWYALSGDWDGDGIKTPGLYNIVTHQWLLSNHNSGGGVSYNFGWGGDGFLPVVGDWDGNGTETPGLYNPKTHAWYLSNHNSGGGVDYKFGWGGDHGVPVAGDWNGDGKASIGLFYPATRRWVLSNHNSGGGIDYDFGWGAPGQIPVVGDWNGDGKDTPGLYNPTTHGWTLSNFNAAHGVDYSFGWGGGDSLPVVGDWDGNGTDTPGLVRGTSWGLSDVNGSNGVNATFGWGPNEPWTVVGAP